MSFAPVSSSSSVAPRAGLSVDQRSAGGGGGAATGAATKGDVVEVEAPVAGPAAKKLDAFEGPANANAKAKVTAPVVESEADRNRRVVDGFYTSFAAKDGKAMAAAYAPGATFSDPVFPKLNGKEAGAMWRMLTGNEGLKLRHEIVKVDGDTVTARWVANYALAGRKIENHITATIQLKDGKIVVHKDQFDLSSWLKQAYGGLTMLPFGERILGGVTRFAAGRQLDSFIEKNGI